MSQAESAEIKSTERKVIRVESEETRDCVCEMLTISPQEAEELAFVPLANYEEPCTSATITAVKKRSDTGSLRQRWFKKVEKLEQ